MRILVINPGSTSTKIAVYEEKNRVFLSNIMHSVESLSRFGSIYDQYEFRKEVVISELRKASISLDFDAVIGRGGLSKPLEGGVYEVTQEMIDDVRSSDCAHACDLGCVLADDIASHIPGSRSFIADPPTVDEMEPEARLSGSPLMPRLPIWHALNQRAVARRFAREHGGEYADYNLIVCHLGGGISVAAHRHGRAIDVNHALGGDGPFSPERAGTLPATSLVKLCFSGRYSEAELQQRLIGNAGMTAHLGTNDMREALARIDNGDKHAELVVDAMIYGVAKAIASKGAALCGKVDAILLTGGLAYSDYLVSRLKHRVEYLAPIYVYPGEDEMESLADNAFGALTGEIDIKKY